MARAAEARRLADTAADTADWQRWGTYVSDRAWGTVREDCSADGDAWEYFPHDHARSRAYRWNEDALAGFCDRDQHLCLGLGLWNGLDPTADLVAQNRLRGSHEPEYELFDAAGHAFRAQRYFDVSVEYAKAGPEDVLCRIWASHQTGWTALVALLLQYRGQVWFDQASSGASVALAGAGAAGLARPA